MKKYVAERKGKIHVTEMAGVVTAEDELFFQTAKRLLEPGGYIVWGNAIPDSTWKPCLAYLAVLGSQKNFARHPGTRLYENRVDGTDTYKVVLLQKPA